MEPISEQKLSVTKPVNFDPSKRPRRQDFKVSIFHLIFYKCIVENIIFIQGDVVENGMFYFSRRNILEEGRFQAGNCGFVEIPQEYSIEIDSPFDLAFAEQVLSKEYIQLFM